MNVHVESTMLFVSRLFDLEVGPDLRIQCAMACAMPCAACAAKVQLFRYQ